VQYAIRIQSFVFLLFFTYYMVCIVYVFYLSSYVCKYVFVSSSYIVNEFVVSQRSVESLAALPLYYQITFEFILFGILFLFFFLGVFAGHVLFVTLVTLSFF
jgi:hypothetical protein